MVKDDVVIGNVQKRLLRAYLRQGAWRKVGASLGVDHGIVIALVKHGRVPKNAETRSSLGLPGVMPSERRARVRRVMPRLGSPCWMCMAFKKVKPIRSRTSGLRAKGR